MNREEFKRKIQQNRVQARPPLTKDGVKLNVKKGKKGTIKYASLPSHTKEVVKLLGEQEQALWQRLQSQDLSPSTHTLFENFIKQSNEQALNFVGIGEFTTATFILRQCQSLLKMPLATEYPHLKFLTYNNIAHAHNNQGNVQLSLQNLLKALKFALLVPNVDSVAYEGPVKVTIVETYLNISSSLTFQGQLEGALEYAEGAVAVSQRIIDNIMSKMEQQEGDERLEHNYNLQIELSVKGLQTKGQLLEKLKRYEEAIYSYQMAKQLIERNFDTNHRMYVELVNHINGAKLRTKYFQNSNLGNHAATRSIHVLENPPQNKQRPQSGNLFHKEMDRMKPIHQQQIVKRLPSAQRLRNSSISSFKDISPEKMNSRNAQRASMDLRGSRFENGLRNSIHIYSNSTSQSLNTHLLFQIYFSKAISDLKNIFEIQK